MSSKSKKTTTRQQLECSCCQLIVSPVSTEVKLKCPGDTLDEDPVYIEPVDSNTEVVHDMVDTHRGLSRYLLTKCFGHQVTVPAYFDAADHIYRLAGLWRDCSSSHTKDPRDLIRLSKEEWDIAKSRKCFGALWFVHSETIAYKDSPCHLEIFNRSRKSSDVHPLEYSVEHQLYQTLGSIVLSMRSTNTITFLFPLKDKTKLAVVVTAQSPTTHELETKRKLTSTYVFSFGIATPKGEISIGERITQILPVYTWLLADKEFDMTTHVDAPPSQSVETTCVLMWSKILTKKIQKSLQITRQQPIEMLFSNKDKDLWKICYIPIDL